MEIDAPSGISATASAGEATTLSMRWSLMLDAASRASWTGFESRSRGEGLPSANMEPTYSMPAEQAAEALMASMKLNGIDRLWFTSGTELAFFQEVPVKHQALGRPTPRIMTMTHENAALSAAMGETMITGKPSSTAAHVECGMINAGGSIHNADRGHYPVLMMSGYPPSAETGSVPGARDAGIQWYQQIRDQGELVRQYMRWDHKLASYDNPGTVVTRAVQVMLSEPQGPAYLAIPREAAMRPMDGATFPLLEPAAAGAQPGGRSRPAPPGGEVAARSPAADDLRLARRSRPVGGAGAGRAGRDARRPGDGRRLPREHSRRTIRWRSVADRCPGRRRTSTASSSWTCSCRGRCRCIGRARTSASSRWRSTRFIA